MIGIGGKVEKEETTQQAAKREVQEEINVKVAISDLQFVGRLNFYFPHIED